MMTGARGMASITIRNLDDALKSRLRIQAAQHQRSMEEEARDILRCALAGDLTEPAMLATAINDLFRPYGGIDLPEASREPMRKPPGNDR